MRFPIAIAVLFACTSCTTLRESEPRESEPPMSVEEVLRDYHDAAAKADKKRLFSHFAPEAVVWGTAVEEEWPLAKFKELFTPDLDRGEGWVSEPTRILVRLDPKERTAWFFENLKSEKWGEMRSSGICRRIDGRWKIATYVTSFPIPNEMVPDVTKQIRARK